MKEHIATLSEQPRPSTADKFDSKRDIAARLQKSTRTVEVWTRQGKIPCLKIGRSILYSWPDVERSLRENYMVNARGNGGTA
jgi:hypothetical protein